MGRLIEWCIAHPIGFVGIAPVMFGLGMPAGSVYRSRAAARASGVSIDSRGNR